MDKTTPHNIDEYVAGFSPDIQEILQNIREIIRRAAPEAEEAMAYGIPTFRLNGNLVHFAAFKKHIGFYPTPSGIEQFSAELSAYANAKGSVQFPLDQPIPYDLIERITAYRVQENQAKAKAKSRKKD